MKKKYIFPTILIFVLTIIDLLSKSLFTNKIFFENSLISIHFSKNFGSSFGIFSNVSFYSYFVTFLAIIVLITLIYYKKTFFKNKYLTYTFIFMFSGILGNTIDRILFGYVRDFISLKHLFIFNLADFYITLAFILYLIYEASENKSLKS